MTEESNTTPESEQPQANPISPEVISLLKEKLLRSFDDAYLAFIQSLGKLPCLKMHSDRAFMFFDSGALWLKDGILKLPVEAFTSTPIPVNPTAAPPIPAENSPEQNDAA